LSSRPLKQIHVPFRIRRFAGKERSCRAQKKDAPSPAVKKGRLTWVLPYSGRHRALYSSFNYRHRPRPAREGSEQEKNALHHSFLAGR